MSRIFIVEEIIDNIVKLQDQVNNNFIFVNKKNLNFVNDNDFIEFKNNKFLLREDLKNERITELEKKFNLVKSDNNDS